MEQCVLVFFLYDVIVMTGLAAEARSYLGLAVSGYPNYFMFIGPNCPIGNGPVLCGMGKLWPAKAE